jgi:hypothetical protein
VGQGRVKQDGFQVGFRGLRLRARARCEKVEAGFSHKARSTLLESITFSCVQAIPPKRSVI